MKAVRRSIWLALAAAVGAALVCAAEIQVSLRGEQVGKPPVIFEPIVGTWLVAQDGGEKVIMLDGRPWVASKDNPTRLLVETARKLYGTSNEELMDNAKQFAYYPVAILKSVDSFSNGSISVKFSDRNKPFMLDKSAWHELKMTVDGASFHAFLDGAPALEYTLGSEPAAGRRGPPNADLYPANNPVLRPPVSGKVGLWSKTDSTSYFKDYLVSPK